MSTVALVGTAHIHTPNFVKRLLARDDVQVKYVWDPQPARARQRAEELSAQATDAPDYIWADREVEAAIICSETNRHEGLVLSAAAAKKHIFVDIPL